MTRRILFAAAFAALITACSPPPHEVQQDREAATAEYATVDAPASGARVSSPLAVSGEAPAAWYFEEQFDTYLMSDDGTVLAQAQARAQSEGEGARPFTAELAFTVTIDTPATLVLQEQSMGEDEGEPLEVRVPVALTPAG